MISRIGIVGLPNPNVGKGVVREELAFFIQAFGGPVDQLSTKLEHARRTSKTLFPSTAEKICLHLYCHRTVADAQHGFDCKPHRYISGCHEHLSTYDSAGALERSTEGHVEGALAIRNGVNRESKVPREGHIAQQLLKLRFIARQGHENECTSRRSGHK